MDNIAIASLIVLAYLIGYFKGERDFGLYLYKRVNKPWGIVIKVKDKNLKVEEE